MAVLRLLILLLVPLMANSLADIPEFRRWCFYTNWAQYRDPKVKFIPENIEPELCTHISYAFAVIKNNAIVPYEWNDEDNRWSSGMYTRLNQMKMKNPDLKTMLAVGGWKLGSLPFTNVVSSKSNREQFIQSVVTLLRKYKFDGLDICWMFPTEGSSPLDDKEKFGDLLKEMKDAFKYEANATGNNELLLGIVVGADDLLIDKAYDIDAINKSVDVISILSYNYYFPGISTYAMHPSALYSGGFTAETDYKKNVNYTAYYWDSLGVPKEKINIGIPFYGRSFAIEGYTIWDAKEGLPSTYAGDKGTYTRRAGFQAYFEICEQNPSSVFMEDRGVPFTVVNNNWIGYEDVKSVKYKTNFALENGFGGLMFWTLDLDDFNAICGGKKYPLLNAANEVIKDYYNSTEMSTVSSQ